MTYHTKNKSVFKKITSIIETDPEQEKSATKDSIPYGQSNDDEVNPIVKQILTEKSTLTKALIFH